MGMAASQARLLGLQARRSNLEYQAQQINQERSVLSQQCTAMYNSLLAMNVPTPPSTGDYTKLEYSGVDGATSFSIGNVKPDGSGTYVVEIKRSATGHKLEQEMGTYKITESTQKTPSYDPDGNLILDENGNIIYQELDQKGYAIGENGEIPCLEWDVAMTALGGMSAEYEKALRNTFGEDVETKDFYVCITTSESGELIAKFMKKEDVSGQDKFANSYEYIPNGDFTNYESIPDCKLEFNAQGMIIKIGIPNPTGITWVELTATKVTDSAAYEDAMNQYEYAQYEYDRKQEEINAKTEIIQQQDRNLELKLQRLDTERQQIEAEYEAIEKVIKDNIDKSFKTFSG